MAHNGHVSWLPPSFSGSTDEMLIALQWRRDELLDLAAAARLGTDSVRTLALTWAADLAVLQCAVLEHLVLESRTPRRSFFESGERIAQSLSGFAEIPALDEVRARMVEAIDAELVPVVMAAWEAVPTFTSPTLDEVRAAAIQRTGGRSLENYADERRAFAAGAMLDAQHHRVRQQAQDAFARAFESDVAMLDAYLAASAAAVGDSNGLTIIARREVALKAASTLTVPEDFIQAVHLVRATLVNALGPGDGERLQPTFIAVL